MPRVKLTGRNVSTVCGDAFEPSPEPSAGFAGAPTATRMSAGCAGTPKSPGNAGTPTGMPGRELVGNGGGGGRPWRASAASGGNRAGAGLAAGVGTVVAVGADAALGGSMGALLRRVSSSAK